MIKADFAQLYKTEISIIAKKHNLTSNEVIKIYYLQFKLIQDQMRKDYKLPFEQRSSIKVLGLGTFVYYPKLAKHIQKEYGKEYRKKISRIEKTPEDGDRNSID